MRKYLLAGAIALVTAVPAAATTDNSPYVGIEGGVMWPKSQTIFGTIDFTNPATADVDADQCRKPALQDGMGRRHDRRLRLRHVPS